MLLPVKFCIRDAICDKSLKIPHIFQRFNKLDAANASRRTRQAGLLSRYRTAFVRSLGNVSPFEGYRVLLLEKRMRRNAKL